MLAVQHPLPQDCQWHAHHSRDALALIRSLNTTTALAGSVPVGVRDGGTEEARRKGVGGERASAALNIAAVEGGLARERAADKIALVNSEARSGSSVGGAGRQGDGGDGVLEEHLDGCIACCVLVSSVDCANRPAAIASR